jgi:hypothetical protein
VASQAARQVDRVVSALGRLQDSTPQRWQSMVIKRKKIEVNIDTNSAKNVIECFLFCCLAAVFHSGLNHYEWLQRGIVCPRFKRLYQLNFDEAKQRLSAPRL